MNTKDIILKVINLPHDFYRLKDVSVYRLLQDSGYFIGYNQISNDDILLELKHHNNAINDWINWSTNKRLNNGWYFERTNDGYVVGDHSTGQIAHKQFYNDATEACAAFIKNEIEDIRNG